MIVGNESMWMWGADQGQSKGRTNGWYAPAVNIHRNPLGGRNFEYYSQCGMQSALIVAAITKGATDMGCHVYLKHAFLNEQETNRGNIVTFATEQAIREIYAKPFEMAVKKGNGNGIMHGLNRIGLEFTSSYTTNILLYTQQWGYRGLSVTDWWFVMGVEEYGYQMIRGLVIPLGDNRTGVAAIKGTWDSSKRDGKGNVVIDGVESLTQWYYTRELTKRVCYTTVNSNAANNGYYSGYLSDIDSELTYGKETAVKIFGSNTQRVLSAFGSTSAFTVVCEGLPKGLSYDADSCSVVGKPTEVGAFAVNIALRGNGGFSYIADNATLNLNVAADPNPAGSPVYLDNKTASFASAYTGTISQNITNDSNYVPGGAANEANLGKYVKVSYDAEGLPAGLSLDKNTGVITGAPTEFGDFNVTVTAKLGVVKKGGGWWGTTITVSNENHSTIVKMSVAANGAFNVTFAANYAGGKDTVKAFASAGTTVKAAFEGVTAPEREGYKFLGWATDAKASAADVDITAETAISAATTYYAVWQAPQIAIIDGYWYIDGVNTGIVAAGENGYDGIDGNDGSDGVGIVSVSKVGEEGLNDVYEMIMSDGSTFRFTIANGADGKNGQDGEAGPQGPKGDAGEAKGSCGGIIGVPTVVGSILIVLAAFVIVLVRKNKSKK